jgi:hypothetical protein
LKLVLARWNLCWIVETYAGPFKLMLGHFSPLQTSVP